MNNEIIKKIILIILKVVILFPINTHADIADNTGIEYFKHVSRLHKNEPEKAYRKASKYFEELTFSEKLEFWIVLSEELARVKEMPYSYVVMQSISEFLMDKKGLTDENYNMIFEAISDKQLSPTQRIGLMGKLLFHRDGYVDSSYMSEKTYYDFHDELIKNITDKENPENVRVHAIKNIELLTHNQLVVSLRNYRLAALKLKAREPIRDIVSEGSLKSKPDISARLNKIDEVVKIFKILLEDPEVKRSTKKIIVSTFRKLKKISVEDGEVIDNILKKHIAPTDN